MYRSEISLIFKDLCGLFFFFIIFTKEYNMKKKKKNSHKIPEGSFILYFLND